MGRSATLHRPVPSPEALATVLKTVLSEEGGKEEPGRAKGAELSGALSWRWGWGRAAPAGSRPRRV